MIESDFLLDIACGKDSKVNQMYHRAHKKISHVDPESGETIVPNRENGWKFELFLHNYLPMTDKGKLGLLMVDR